MYFTSSIGIIEEITLTFFLSKTARNVSGWVTEIINYLFDVVSGPTRNQTHSSTSWQFKKK